MTTIMRRTVRGTATALGALAIVVGTAGCGSLLGGGDDTRTDDQEQGQEQDGADTGDSTEEDAPADDSGDASSEDTGDATSEDDQATEDQATDAEDSEGDAGGTGDTSGTGDQDGEDSGDASDSEGTDTAAGALSDEDLDNASQRFIDFMQVMDDGDGEAACAFFLDPDTQEPVSGETLTLCGEIVTPQMEALEPGTMDILDASMVTATDNGDGTVSIDVMGSEFPNPMVQASDGEWYLSLG